MARKRARVHVRGQVGCAGAAKSRSISSHETATDAAAAHEEAACLVTDYFSDPEEVPLLSSA